VLPTLAQTAAVGGFARAAMRWRLSRHDAGEAVESVADWRIAENRWSALRYGVEGALADLATGRLRGTRERLLDLIDTVEPYSDAGLDGARAMTRCNAAMDLRTAGLRSAARWLTSVFAAEGPPSASAD
jgi:carboxylate-amine ligase